MSSRVLRAATAVRLGFVLKQQQQHHHLTCRTITSSPQVRHKESHSHEENVDKHKQDLLTKHKSGKGHWKPELASDSEEAVKADRAGASEGGESSSSKEAIKRLQERTKKAAEETSKAGTSMRDGL